MDRSDFLRGVELFNRGEFFDAHEVLEDVWRAAPVGEKKFLQGMVQIAVAFHHYSTGNRVGMRSVLERAIGNLSEPSGRWNTFDLPGLLISLNDWRACIDKGSEPPALPRIDANE